MDNVVSESQQLLHEALEAIGYLDLNKDARRLLENTTDEKERARLLTAIASREAWVRALYTRISGYLCKKNTPVFLNDEAVKQVREALEFYRGEWAAKFEGDMLSGHTWIAPTKALLDDCGDKATHAHGVLDKLTAKHKWTDITANSNGRLSCYPDDGDDVLFIAFGNLIAGVFINTIQLHSSAPEDDYVCGEFGFIDNTDGRLTTVEDVICWMPAPQWPTTRGDS